MLHHNSDHRRSKSSIETQTDERLLEDEANVIVTLTIQLTSINMGIRTDRRVSKSSPKERAIRSLAQVLIKQNNRIPGCIIGAFILNSSIHLCYGRGPSLQR